MIDVNELAGETDARMQDIDIDRQAVPMLVVVPLGSYLHTSKHVSVTLRASCQKADLNTWAESTLTFTAASAGVNDIANLDGVLTLISIPPQTHRTPSGSRFVPEGSYILTSKDVAVTIEATCANFARDWVKSTLTFTKDQAASLRDISNLNGVLTAVPRAS